MSKKQNVVRKPAAKKASATPKKGPKPAKAAKVNRAAAKAKPAPAGPAKPKKLSCINAAAMVLAKSGKPMRVAEMIEQMRVRGLWTSPQGKTPEASLYAAVIREIAAKGAGARFKKVERGLFAATGKA